MPNSKVTWNVTDELDELVRIDDLEQAAMEFARTAPGELIGAAVGGMFGELLDTVCDPLGLPSTLDITSGGRLELGIGADRNEEESDAFGIELGSMRERFDQFEEGLEVLDSLLTNERTTDHPSPHLDSAGAALTGGAQDLKPAFRSSAHCDIDPMIDVAGCHTSRSACASSASTASKSSSRCDKVILPKYSGKSARRRTWGGTREARHG